MDFADGKIDEVEEYLEYRNEKLSNTATLGQFLSSHDEDGFLYRVGGDVGKLKVASALQITAKGQPVIYYGEELGMTGKNAGDMSKGEFRKIVMIWIGRDLMMRDIGIYMNIIELF